MGYFIGGIGDTFGQGGNFMSQLGQLGPAWQRTQEQALKYQGQLRNFMDNEEIRPDNIWAINEQNRQAALQAYQQAYQTNIDNKALIDRNLTATTIDVARNLDHANQRSNDTLLNNVPNRQTPVQAKPSQSAATGAYSSTAPQSGLNTALTLYTPLTRPKVHEGSESANPFMVDVVNFSDFYRQNGG